MGRRRPPHREPEPRPVDLRRVPRLRRLGAVVDRGPAARRRGLRPHGRPDVLAHRPADPGGRHAAHPLHVRGAGLRGPQLDHRVRPAPAAAHPRARVGGPEPRPALRRPPRDRRARGRRRRQLRLLDGEHLLLLPGEGEGPGARPQRRGRQHRHGGRAVRRPARHHHRRRDPARACRPHVRPAHPDRGGARVALHGQPVHREVGPARVRRGRPQQAHVDHLVHLHRHVRLVHRLLGRFPDAAEEPVPRRHAHHRLRGRSRGIARPAGGRCARRPSRRRPGHHRLVRGDGRRNA